MTTSTEALRLMAHRAIPRPRFLAGLLAAWQQREELTDAQAVERLGLTGERDYYLLGSIPVATGSETEPAASGADSPEGWAGVPSRDELAAAAGEAADAQGGGGQPGEQE